MKTATLLSNGQGILSIGLALMAAVFVYLVLANKNVPLISNMRGALVVLVILGFVMCTAAGLSGKVDRDGFSWFSPFVILGMLLGMTAIYVAFAGVTDRNLPFVTGERGAFILLAGIIAIQWVLSRVHTLLLG